MPNRMGSSTFRPPYSWLSSARARCVFDSSTRKQNENVSVVNPLSPFGGPWPLGLQQTAHSHITSIIIQYHGEGLLKAYE